MDTTDRTAFDASHASAIASGESRTGLLVSVRSAAEARDAVAGGAAVIDVKEPSRGPLGRADDATTEAVIEVVNGMRPVTVALGELRDWTGSRPLGGLSGQIAVLKLGLSGLSGSDWRGQLDHVRDTLPADGPLVAAVAYADDASGAPDVADVVRYASQTDRWVVIDTWEKRDGDSIAHLGVETLSRHLALADRFGVRVVLAGSLAGERITAAARLGPALVGLRGALCAGEREGTLDPRLVRLWADRLRQTPAATGPEAR